MPFFFTGLIDLQNLLSLVLHALRHVFRRRFVIQDDLEHLAEVHLFDRQLGADEGIGADLTFDVDRLINFDFVGHHYLHSSISDC